RIDIPVTGVERRPRPQPAPGWIAQDLVALMHSVTWDERPPPVLGRVDHEVLAPGETRDHLAVADLSRRPVEMGGVEEEALDLGHARLSQQPCRPSRGQSISRPGLEIDDEMGK